MKIIHITRKNMTPTRYTIYTSIAIGLFVALSGLLSSCEKEPVGEGSGRKVAVNILLNSSGYVDATRSSVAPTPKSETAIIHRLCYEWVRCR
jgi:hypothetical protein